MLKHSTLSAIAATALFCVAAGPSVAQDAALPTSLIDSSVIQAVRGWAQAPIVIEAIKSANAKHAAFTQDQIDTADKQWRAETKQDDQPMITAVLVHPLSNYLTRIQARSLGLYSEIFVMDDKGLNVGQSSITSDFWQGDEAKFQKTYPLGPDAVFIDEAEMEDSTKTWRAQLNLTVVDPQSKAAIGAITVELNLTELDRRRRAGLNG